MEEDTQPILDKHGGSERLLELIYLAHSIECNKNPNHWERPDNFLNIQVYNIVEKAFVPTYLLLSSFHAIAKGRTNILQYKPSYYRTYNPLDDRSKITDRKKKVSRRQSLLDGDAIRD
jgi:hypothetical protein